MSTLVPSRRRSVRAVALTLCTSTLSSSPWFAVTIPPDGKLFGRPGEFSVFFTPFTRISGQSGDFEAKITPFGLADPVPGEFGACFPPISSVTVPLKEGIDAKYLRLRCIKGPNQSGAVHQLHIYDSYFNYGRLGGAYSVGQSATDGAVFYMFLYESFFTNNDDAINFELVDVSSGSKVHYKYTTSVSKVFPLSNGADIKDVEYPGGSALNAYGAVKVPVFNGAADSNWIEYIP